MAKESEPPIDLVEARRRKLLGERDTLMHQVNLINQELARMAAGIETLAQKQMRRPFLVLPAQQPPLNFPTLSRSLPSPNPVLTDESYDRDMT